MYTSIQMNFQRIHLQISRTQVWNLGVKYLQSRLFSQFSHSTTEMSQSELEEVKRNEKDQGKHIKITSQNFRDPTISEAIVTEIYPLSATVKGYTLRILNPKLFFYAGQWVDAFIPGMDVVGGFSICSSPAQLKEEGLITLGIKRSSWPPALWFYEKCQRGSKLSVRVGGDFFYPHDDGGSSDLLLVAGGVGVNPIHSIYLHYSHLRSIGKILKDSTDMNLGRLSLIFSAKSQDELLYKATFDSVAEAYPQDISLQYFVTRDFSEDLKMGNGRITSEDIGSSLNKLDLSRTKVYICGPPSMIKDLEEIILKFNIPKSRIYYEKWW